MSCIKIMVSMVIFTVTYLVALELFLSREGKPKKKRRKHED